jgi:hypothetical protein
MRYLLTTCLLIFYITTLYGQAPNRKVLDSFYVRPELMIDGKSADPLSLLLLDSRNIKSLTVTKSTETSNNKKIKSLVKVSTISSASVLSISELIRSFDFKAEALQLPLLVSFGFATDYLYTTDPSLLKASLSEIESVGIGWQKGKDFQLKIVKADPGDKLHNDIFLRLDSINKVFFKEAYYRRSNLH